MYTITVTSRKGGVCKTTVAVNLAAALALEGQRVLLVDLDSQANASRTLLGDADNPEDPWPPAEPTAAHVLIESATIAEAARPSNRSGVDIVPASQHLVGAQMQLVDKKGRETILRRALRLVSGYDIVIFDTGPEEGLVKVNALVASTHVLMPFDPEAAAVEGMNTTAHALAELAAAELPCPALLGCLQVRLDRRYDVTDEWRENVRSVYGPLLFESSLRANSLFLICTAWHRDIFKVEADKRPRRGSEDFKAIAAEVLQRLKSTAAQAAA